MTYPTEAVRVGGVSASDVWAPARSSGADDHAHQMRGMRSAPKRRGAGDDVVVCRLSDRWIVKADNLQWLLCRWKKDARYPEGGFWKPVAFVASTKAILERCIRENGAEVDDAGKLALGEMPDTFSSTAEMKGAA